MLEFIGIYKSRLSIFFRTFVGSSSNQERCQSDRLGRTRNPVNGLSVPGVWIPLSPLEVLCKMSRQKLQKSVSVVISRSYDTFILCPFKLSEYVKRSYERPKYSSVATIWLHFFEPPKNCSQEFVESSFRVLVFCCYSNNYVELWAGLQRLKQWTFGYNQPSVRLQFLCYWLQLKTSKVWSQFSEQSSILEATM